MSYGPRSLFSAQNMRYTECVPVLRRAFETAERQQLWQAMTSLPEFD